MVTRRTLADRNRDAIMAPASVGQEAPASAAWGTKARATTAAKKRTDQKKQPAEATTTAQSSTAATTRATATSGVTKSPLSLYLPRRTFEDARAAYLTDWTLGGTADTLGGWMGQALTTHAHRTPQERRALADARATAGGGGDLINRLVPVPDHALQDMRTGITADQDSNRWLSDSRWAVEAIDAAIDTTRAATGGQLLQPPKRLPNRLVR